MFEFWSSDRGDFWASPVEILMFARVTGCMLTSAGFDFIHLEHILKNTLKRAVIFLQSKTKGHFTRAKSRDPVMVRTLDSHPKAIPWVLGKPFYVVTDPHAECEVRMDHVGGKRGEDLVLYNMSHTLPI